MVKDTIASAMLAALSFVLSQCLGIECPDSFMAWLEIHAMSRFRILGGRRAAACSYTLPV
jgi:hypothetical protein